MTTRRLLPLLLLCLALPLTVCAQAAARGAAEATVNKKKVSISYGRPALKGRDLLAQAKPGMTWRVGMNQATEITSKGDMTVGGTTLKAGKYTLWVRKTGEDTWTLAFHANTGVWGAPPLTEGYAAEMPLKLKKSADSADLLVIDLADKKGDAEIKIHWGTAVLTGTFGVK
ncbi:MAG: DUF2911 domain-containing protein [Acidobacteria bacterium]|nr:DUF2911 domain-containing protein [Acidobacteriota bacterium]